ncbi:hypothetical protein EJ06DRAFT_79439 [Trichodelitschia bisporula]|uniref:Uncharacterized protein n=1 Tax=Trichodelitschia bisporula TaxID=703511 RepID=A0A6G1HTQ6_9PEZI|nr:hypothetical protein EJ06DRAFT_79439 [Trichodelitschia bisporula]
MRLYILCNSFYRLFNPHSSAMKNLDKPLPAPILKLPTELLLLIFEEAGRVSDTEKSSIFCRRESYRMEFITHHLEKRDYRKIDGVCERFREVAYVLLYGTICYEVGRNNPVDVFRTSNNPNHPRHRNGSELLHRSLKANPELRKLCKRLVICAGYYELKTALNSMTMSCCPPGTFSLGYGMFTKSR